MKSTANITKTIIGEMIVFPNGKLPNCEIRMIDTNARKLLKFRSFFGKKSENALFRII